MKYVNVENKPFEDFREVIKKNSKPNPKDDWLVKYVWWICLSPVILAKLTEPFWEPQFTNWSKPFFTNGFVMIVLGAFLTFIMIKAIRARQSLYAFDIRNAPTPLKLINFPSYIVRLCFKKETHDIIFLIGYGLCVAVGITSVIVGIYVVIVNP